jgi:sterol desaturase/sphingolipid hydroxylase (fatty acid hydroxylase superfamily)
MPARPPREEGGVRRVLSYGLWPGLLGGCLWLNGQALESAHPIAFFNVVYLLLAVVLLGLERLMPFEPAWLENDGQAGADLGHTFINKGLMQLVASGVVAMGIAQAVDPNPGGPWPGSWPVWAQVALGLVIAECGLYLAHRLAHEWPKLWCFHAVHHSVTRLWVVNTGRFHFVDTFVSILMSQPLLYLAGAPTVVFLWVSAVTAFIGMLTHSNIEMRFGPISLVFNTPGLHRWHHSMDLREGNKNYGENLMVWDLAFGTYFDADRRPPAEIGIDGPMPANFVGQLVAPFTAQGRQDLPREQGPRHRAKRGD